MVQQKAVPVPWSENECLASSEILAGIAAVCCGASAISHSVEIGTDSWTVVGDIDSIIRFTSAAEVGAKRIQSGTRVIDGRARDDGGGGCGSCNSAGLEGGCECSHTRCESGGNC